MGGRSTAACSTAWQGSATSTMPPGELRRARREGAPDIPASGSAATSGWGRRGPPISTRSRPVYRQLLPHRAGRVVGPYSVLSTSVTLRERARVAVGVDVDTSAAALSSRARSSNAPATCARTRSRGVAIGDEVKIGAESVSCRASGSTRTRSRPARTSSRASSGSRAARRASSETPSGLSTRPPAAVRLAAAFGSAGARGRRRLREGSPRADDQAGDDLGLSSMGVTLPTCA